MTKRKNKNRSHKIGDGRTMQTRDNYLEGGKNYSKAGYENKGLYRLIIVLSSNKRDELIVTKGTTKGKYRLTNYKNGMTTYNPYIYTKDDEGNPIKVNFKFKLNKKSNSVSKKDVNTMNYNCYKNNQTSKRLRKENKSKARKAKNRE